MSRTDGTDEWFATALRDAIHAQDLSEMHYTTQGFGEDATPANTIPMDTTTNGSNVNPLDYFQAPYEQAVAGVTDISTTDVANGTSEYDAAAQPTTNETKAYDSNDEVESEDSPLEFHERGTSAAASRPNRKIKKQPAMSAEQQQSTLPLPHRTQNQHP